MHHGACSVLAVASMPESPYLVAGRRALPLTGKSLSLSSAEASDPGETGLSLALELLLRLWQRSEDGPLQRAAADASLLVVELPFDKMTEQLPRLKADWILSGDTPAFLSGLDALAMRGWRVAFAKYEPVSFIPWP
jgi:hypothetical protein